MFFGSVLLKWYTCLDREWKGKRERRSHFQKWFWVLNLRPFERGWFVEGVLSSFCTRPPYTVLGWEPKITSLFWKPAKPFKVAVTICNHYATSVVMLYHSKCCIINLRTLNVKRLYVSCAQNENNSAVLSRESERGTWEAASLQSCPKLSCSKVLWNVIICPMELASRWVLLVWCSVFTKVLKKVLNCLIHSWVFKIYANMGRDLPYHWYAVIMTSSEQKLHQHRRSHPIKKRHYIITELESVDSLFHSCQFC